MTREPFWIFTHLATKTNAHNFRFNIPDNEGRGYVFRVAFFHSGSTQIEPEPLIFVENSKLLGEEEGSSFWPWINYYLGKYEDGDFDCYFDHPKEFYSLYGFLMYPE